jgi:hypothetical protein
MVFAANATHGAKGAADCPEMKENDAKKLNDYFSQFRFD